MTIQQLARAWWSDIDDAKRAATRSRVRMRQLANAGLVEISQALTHPELPLTAPVIAWAPGDAEPELGPAAYRLRKRWTGRLSPTTLVTITPQAAPQFGGYAASALRDDELSHDVHLAAVFLHYRSTAPELAAHWIGERVIRRLHPGPGGVVPDAMIRANSTVRLIDFGGAYPAQRVRIFHDHCAARGVSYEVW